MVNDERTIGMNPSNNTLLYPTIKSTQHQKKMSSFHVNPVQPVTLFNLLLNSITLFNPLFLI